MKEIPLFDGKKFKTADLIRQLCGAAEPGQGFSPDEMRKRIRILAALDDAKGAALMLEDADHEMLKSIVNAASYIVADPELLQIIDAVNDAKAPAAQ